MAIQINGWSVVAQYRKCGKPTCRVCAEGKGHGPYYYGTKAVDGRRYSRYFGAKIPVETSDTQDSTQEMIALRRQVETLTVEVARLQEENASLRAGAAVQQSESPLSSAPTVSTVPPQNEQPHQERDAPPRTDTKKRRRRSSSSSSAELKLYEVGVRWETQRYLIRAKSNDDAKRKFCHWKGRNPSDPWTGIGALTARRISDKEGRG